ncbi:helix-turn-helix domain-containing protein, partial [Enterococcus faecalis]|nr:helix-turn-helix domain-containing protein [Enterococcus faecalis]
MNLNKFLNEEDSYKYYIVKMLETKSNVFLSENHLIELLGLSKYKFEKFIKNIEEDGKFLKIPISIKIEISGEIVVKGIDNLAVKKLRLYYLENSRQYKILWELLVGKSINSDNLPTKLFLSRSSFYNELR